MKKLYKTNTDFRQYVDRYCKHYRISVEEALEHELVRSVGREYREQENNLDHD